LSDVAETIVAERHTGVPRMQGEREVAENAGAETPESDYDPEEERKAIYAEEDLRDEELDLVLKFIFGMNGEHKDGSVGITVSVGGTVISGNAVNYQVWNDLVIEGIRAAGADGVADAMRRVSNTRDEVHEKMVERREKHGVPAPPFGYLHLRDARLITGSAALSGPGLWRVRTDRIDGWSFTTYGA
jgi:hypothetical protein